MSQASAFSCAFGDALGNRFLIAPREDLERQGANPSQVVPLLCEEEFDGLLVVGDVDPLIQDVVIWNRDGTPGGVCFNGLCLVATWLGGDSGLFLMDGREVPWRLTEKGIELHLTGKSMSKDMQIAMIVTSAGPGLCVPFWNPDCVVPVADVDDIDLQMVADSVRAAELYFPDGANVEIVSEDGPGRVNMRVNERGVGETKSCGSGAVAVALSAWAGGLDGPLAVSMPGGTIHLRRASDGGVKLSGEAKIDSTKNFSINF